MEKAELKEKDRLKEEARKVNNTLEIFLLRVFLLFSKNVLSQILNNY
jgi:hypothetical protein